MTVGTTRRAVFFWALEISDSRESDWLVVSKTPGGWLDVLFEAKVP